VNKLLGLALAATITIGAASAAAAREGCGGGYHRGPAGYCRPNKDNRFREGPAVIVRPGIGIFYPGRGYWDGRAYYQHRYRHHNGWRYR
jgi:hypothetical protein